MKILILEDEIITAQDLKNTLLQIDPKIEITGLVDSVKQALVVLGQEIPDLIFADIQLADGLSFEIFSTLDLHCPVVFCTAYDHYALEAFRANGVDYILKPFDRTSLEQCLQRIKLMAQHVQINSSNLLQLNEIKRDYKSSFLVQSLGRQWHIPLSEIFCFLLTFEVVYLHRQDGMRYAMNQSLDEIEKEIDPKLVFRVNRQTLLHIQSICAIEKQFARKLQVNCHEPWPGPFGVSKAKASSFLRWMQEH